MSDAGDQIPIDATIDADASAIERLRASMAEDDAVRVSVARDFVAQARQAQLEADEASPEQEAASGRGRRRSWPIVVAVILGAQILAGGVFVALQSLQPEEQETVATVDESVLVPTVVDQDTTTEVAPTAEPTATFVPTATAVPPTPEWRPVDGGPRWAPFTFVASAIDADASLLAEPQGDPVEATVDGQPLGLTWPSGAPVRFRVISGDPAREWVQVELPDQANTLAWVRADELNWEASYRLVQIDVTANRLRVFEGNDVLFEAVVATGALDTPTSPRQTWLIENAYRDGVADRPVFGFALAGDDEPLELTIADDESVIGQHITDGRVVIAEREAEILAQAVIAGAKFEVIGRPVPPTPTPVPTPTPAIDTSQPETPSTGGGGGGSAGCPRGTQGTVPDCYRVVQREEFPGDCPGLQQPIDDFCMSLAGNPDVVDGNEQCPAQAPERVGDLCYTVQGRIPIVEGDCPASSVEVGGECRDFVDS